MINEFDKEIDAILRKAQSGPSALADGFAAHLDADEISAFAENALPENAKMRVTPHLADCERCRKILSNLILLNSGTTSEFVHQATSAAAAIPWYRKFLAFPNLAYSLGALALVFGTLIVFTILKSDSFQNADLSKMSNKPYEKESAQGAANANSPLAPANVTANPETSNPTSAANTMPPAASNSKTASEFTCEDCGAADEEDEKSKNKDLNPAKDQPVSIDGASGAVKTQKRADDDKKNTDEVTTERQLPAPATLSENKPAQRKAEAKYDSKEGETTSVGGKTFRRQGAAWVDSAYRSGSNMALPSLTYVSRGSSEYKKLDGGLRNIAEKLGGVVIVLWKNKAYRIQ